MGYGKNLNKQGNRCSLYRWESMLLLSICPKFHSVKVSALKFKLRYMYIHLHIHTYIFNLPLELIFLSQFAVNWYYEYSHIQKKRSGDVLVLISWCYSRCFCWCWEVFFVWYVVSFICLFSPLCFGLSVYSWTVYVTCFANCIFSFPNTNISTCSTCFFLL